MFDSTDIAATDIEMSDINVETRNDDPLHGYVTLVLFLS